MATPTYMMLLGFFPKARRWLFQLTRRFRYVLTDVVVFATSFALAYLLRFDFRIPPEELAIALRQTPLVIAIQLACMIGSGSYRFIWRYVGLREVSSFVAAAVGSAVPLLILRFTVSDEFAILRVPLSVIVLSTLLAFSGALAARVLRRVVYEWRERSRRGGTEPSRSAKPILLIGAGRAGRMLAEEVRSRNTGDLQIAGWVDDDPHKQGAMVHGLPVLGTTADLPRLIRERGIDHVVITIARATRQDVRRIVEICERIPVKARIIPSLHEILQGTVTISRIRDIQIEDLLGRAPVDLENEGSRYFLAGRTVMVTGAGGSIGSELARQVARCSPANLLLVERAEFALFNIQQELLAAYPDLVITPVVADVGNCARMARVFAQFSPNIVLHAAAHKHVPLMETNVCEAVVNNVLATKNLAELAGTAKVDVFLLISTDKAVRPTSIMGASKRLAELVIQSLNDEHGTRFLAVRFGNVIGSSGSVIPIFRAQIERGGPVTVTHPDMTRYFMTIPEAARLVLEATSLGRGGEIFVLDMGEPVRILDMAKDIITLSGLKPYEDVDIVYTGTRPGEKLFEELEIREESMSKTRHPKIFIGRIAGLPRPVVRQALVQLEAAALAGAEDKVKQILSEMVPEAQLTPSNPLQPVRVEIQQLSGAAIAVSVPN